MAQKDAIIAGYSAQARTRADLGHISSATDFPRREKNRAEIEAERAADPWLWLEDLLAWGRQHGSQMTVRWDPPPSHSHKKSPNVCARAPGAGWPTKQSEPEETKPTSQGEVAAGGSPALPNGDGGSAA